MSNRDEPRSSFTPRVLPAPSDAQPRGTRSPEGRAAPRDAQPLPGCRDISPAVGSVCSPVLKIPAVFLHGTGKGDSRSVRSI